SYPGSANNTALTDSTTPNSRSYGGQGTCVTITNISPSAATMTAAVSVTCGKAVAKDTKDSKDTRKEIRKEVFKEGKEIRKDLKDRIEGKAAGKDFKERKEFKEVEWPGGGGDPFGSSTSGADVLVAVQALEARLAALESLLGRAPEPFIG